MKKSIFKKALLGLVAIVGVAFTVKPTLIVDPPEEEVYAGVPFAITVTYSDTYRMFVRVIELPRDETYEILLLEETKNISTPTILYVYDMIEASNVERIYQVIAFSMPDENGVEQHTTRGTSVISNPAPEL